MKIELKLKPFTTPNFVLAEHNKTFQRGEGPTFGLNEIEASALSDLCDQFRKDIFKKAGKTDPLIK